MSSRLPFPFCILGLALILASCDSSPTGPGAGSLRLALTGVERLGPGYLYEGWIIVAGSPVSTGTFSVDASGNPSRSDFDVEASLLASATKFVLTIEPTPDPDPAPANTKYLAGDFTGDSAELSVADGAALGSDYSAASGSFILQTPSSANVPGDYANGIWWLDPAAGPGASLALPALPAGWIYEGWVVGQGGPVSTGRFLQTSGTDSDAGGQAAGPDATPPFPGQDFVNPPMSLVGGQAVISIEPEPDDGPTPFALKPLVDANVEDVGLGVPQSMANNAGAFPGGLAMR